MGKKNKKVEEEAPELDSDLALGQAAATLILATEKAEHNNDVAALMKIAGGWMEIHEYLANSNTEEERKTPLGFTNAHTQETEEEEELEDAIAAEARSATRISVGRIHAKHGKFRVIKSGHRNRR
jgi:hypothetical protein